MATALEKMKFNSASAVLTANKRDTVATKYTELRSVVEHRVSFANKKNGSFQAGDFQSVSGAGGQCGGGRAAGA